jgi:uncharacterized membrane protein YcaP (DUF421 family)
VFFESWSSAGRVIATGSCAYVALVLMLRVTGKRTLSKMNAFDFVVTVALGSTLATVLTSKQVPLVDGVVALALLVALQYAVAWGSSRWTAMDRAVKSEPRVVFHRGRFLRRAMRAERLTESEIVSAMRKASVASADEVEAVILESSGDLSVVRRPSGPGQPTLLQGAQLAGDAARGDGEVDARPCLTSNRSGGTSSAP